MKAQNWLFRMLSIITLVAILIPSSSTNVRGASVVGASESSSNAQATTLIFSDDFSADKGWTDESGGYIHRDTANQWLLWQVQRDVTRRYYIPINADSSYIRLNYRFKATSSGGNGNVFFGLVENLSGAQNRATFPTGFFIDMGHDTIGLDLAHHYVTYSDHEPEQPPPGDCGSFACVDPATYLNLEAMNVWRRIELVIDHGNWTMTLYDDNNVQMDQSSGTMASTHSRYQYLMIFRDYTSGWEWYDGLLDDIELYGQHLSAYPLIEGFDSSVGFTQTDPDVYISNGQVSWHVSRREGDQYIYRSIPPFSGDVRLTVRGQIDSWTNNCGVKAGIGDGPGSGVAVAYGFFGGGCSTQGALIDASGVSLNHSLSGCDFIGTWLWVNRGVPYTAELTISGSAVDLSVPGVGSVSGMPQYDGVYDTLYVGLTGDGDWPECSGTIDTMIIEPLSTEDTTPPAVITDLSASTGSTSGTVDLTWTAPGDDGNAGTAGTYIVRYATSAITTEAAWSAANDVSGEPTPSPAGSSESMTVSGLTPGQTYYFAIKTQDEVPNTSGLSNSPSAVAGSVGGQCIRVTTVLPPNNGTFLPIIFRNFDGSPPPRTGPTIKEVTQDTGGCLKFVGDTIHFTLDAGGSGGTATVDIGDVHTGILLYDDGTHGDITAGDGVHELDYVATSADVARSVRIVGHFTTRSGQSAPSAQSEGRVTIADWEAGESSTAPVENSQIATDPDSGIRYAPMRLVVGFVDGVSLGEVQSLLIQYNLTLASWLPKLMVFEIELAEGQDGEIIKQQLLNEPEIEAVDYNLILEPLGSPIEIPDIDLAANQADYLNPIRAKLGWEVDQEKGQGDPSVKVAIIDDGAYSQHPELKNQIARYLCGNLCGGPDDDGEHGTPIAGIIAAEYGNEAVANEGISGIAPNIKLVIINSGKTGVQAADAIVKAADDEEVQIINVSLGVGPGRVSSTFGLLALRKSVKYAYDKKGKVLIAAVGYEKSGCNNSWTSPCGPGINIIKADDGLLRANVIYPASFTRVLAVGATNEFDFKTLPSNYGDQVVFAPSKSILSIENDGSTGFVGGNSFAAPQVAALAALIRSVNPNLTNAQVVNLIIETADRTRMHTTEPISGLGRINIFRALKKASTGNDPGFDDLPEPVSDLKLNLSQGANGPYIQLTWTPPDTNNDGNPDDYAGVHIYRYETDPESVITASLLDGGLIPGSSYTDNDVKPGYAYGYLVFSVDPTGQEAVTEEYDFQPPITIPDVTVDQVSTTDYWGDPKTTFRPGEAIRLTLTATNHLNQTIPVTYTWATYDPNGAKLSYLSYDNYAVSMPPGEDSLSLLSGTASSALLGTYTYTASVSYASGMSADSTTFDVEGPPIPARILESATCKDVDAQTGKPVDVTNVFSTNDDHVFSWSAWEGVSGPHTIRWDWYQPTGALYRTIESDFNYPSSVTYAWSWISISDTGSSLGQWHVEIYVDGSYEETQYFTLTSGTQSQTEPLKPSTSGEFSAGSATLPAPQELNW